MRLDGLNDQEAKIIDLETARLEREARKLRRRAELLEGVGELVARVLVLLAFGLALWALSGCAGEVDRLVLAEEGGPRPTRAIRFAAFTHGPEDEWMYTHVWGGFVQLDETDDPVLFNATALLLDEGWWIDIPDSGIDFAVWAEELTSSEPRTSDRYPF